MLGIMGRGLERAKFCHGIELSCCLVTVRALTETTVTTDCLMVHRKLRLNLNWEKIIVQ